MSPLAVFVLIYRYSNFRTFHYEEVRFEICLFQRLAVGFGFVSVLFLCLLIYTWPTAQSFFEIWCGFKMENN